LLRNRERELVRRVWADWFVGFDALLCPIMPMAPFPHDQGGTVTDRRVVINGESRTHGECLAWTGLVGVTYLPSTAAPAGFTHDGLPVGVQVVGPYMEDLTPLFVARSLEDATGGFRPPPSGI
jgi:amidase